MLRVPDKHIWLQKLNNLIPNYTVNKIGFQKGI